VKIILKSDEWSKKFLVKGWSIEGYVPKVVKQIVMNVGLLILHKKGINSLVTT